MNPATRVGVLSFIIDKPAFNSPLPAANLPTAFFIVEKPDIVPSRSVARLFTSNLSSWFWMYCNFPTRYFMLEYFEETELIAVVRSVFIWLLLCVVALG